MGRISRYLRISFWKNSCPTLQGAIGIYYDSYRELYGPWTFNISFYFFGIYIDVGPELDLSKLDKVGKEL